MRTTALLSLLLIPAIALGVGCTSRQKPSENQVFEFSSGGAYHIEGFGEWQIKLDAAGAFTIAHNVRGEVKDYGTFSLTESEKSELWELVRAADIESIESSQRPGVPDEVQYTFVLSDETRSHIVKLWVNDARKNSGIVALVDRIGVLIEKYAKQKPVLW